MEVDMLNRLNNQLAANQARLREFETAVEQIEIAIEKLEYAIANFNTTLSELRMNYTQTGNPRYEARINDLINTTNWRVTYLRDTVLPSLMREMSIIRTRISFLRTKIRVLQSIQSRVE